MNVVAKEVYSVSLHPSVHMQATMIMTVLYIDLAIIASEGHSYTYTGRSVYIAVGKTECACIYNYTTV